MKYKLLTVGAAVLSFFTVTVVSAQDQNGASGNQAGQINDNDDGAGNQPQGGPPQGQRGPGGPGGGDPDRQAHRQKMLERFDTNHDGVLDDNERAQMRAFMQQRRAMRQNGGAGGGPGGGFGRSGWAPGGGGQSTGGSATSAGGAQGGGAGSGHGQWGGGANNPEREQFRRQMMQKFDTNHDGVLDDSERAEMRAAMQQHRKEMRQNGGPGGPGGPGDSGTGSQQN